MGDTSPVCDLSCSSRRERFLYALSQPVYVHLKRGKLEPGILDGFEHDCESPGEAMDASNSDSEGA
jgi:hypothetical protein